MKEILGGTLLAIGILIAGGSGLCSLLVLFGSGEMSGLSMWPAVLAFGGIPFAIGLGIAFAGGALLRSSNKDRAGPE